LQQEESRISKLGQHGWLLGAGFGLGFRKTDGAYAKDRMGNFMAGVTGQIKISDRVALTGDFTTIPMQKSLTLMRWF
jgi:hypothetical protein